MNKIWILLLMIGMLTVTCKDAEKSAKLQVLIITGGHDFEPTAFFDMFKSFEDIEFTEAVQPQANQLYVTGQARRYDVIVLYDMVQDITDEQKQAMMDTFRNGQGLVVLHHALASYNDWPEYEKLIGGLYHLKAGVKDGQEIPASTFHHDVEVNVHIADPKHPVTAGLQDFVLRDEVYGGFTTEPSIHPLLTTDHPQSSPVIAWSNEYGKSHVVTIQPGHDAHSWNNPNYRKLLHNAIRWVAQPDKK